MANKFSIKKLAAGVLALLMVVTALPVSGVTASVSKAADDDVDYVYRSYNPNSGEHLLTINKAEQDSVVAAGRKDEGIRWAAPKTSDSPIYRSYNPNTGEHLLVTKEEAEWLEGYGWDNEGIKMYSADKDGMPIYRVYNPNASNAGTHVYCEKKEAEWLVAQGWQYDKTDAYFYALYFIGEEIKSVEIDNATPKAGDTITATAYDNSGAVVTGAAYTWTLNGVGVGTGNTYKVPATAEAGDVIVVSAEGTIGEAKTATATVADTELELGYSLTPQADGSYLSGGKLSISYGSGLGTPNVIKWYKNSKIAKSASLNGSTDIQSGLTYSSATKGNWYVEIQNTEGKTYSSNVIELVDDEVAAVIKDVEIIEDYETPNLTYDTKGNLFYVKFNINYPYEGKFYLTKSTTESYVTANMISGDAELTATNGNTTYNEFAGFSANLTEKKKESDMTAKDAGTAEKHGIYYQREDGSYDVIFLIEKTAANALERGESYKLIFDQDAISEDTITNSATTTTKTPNITEAITVPYLTAPSSVKVTTKTAGAAPKMTLYDSEGKALSWFGQDKTGTAQTMTNAKIAAATVYEETGTTKAKAHAVSATLGTATAKEGVLTFAASDTLTAGGSYTYYWGTVSLTKGIFGKDAITLESGITEASTVIGDITGIASDSSAVSTAKIGLSNVRDDATLFIYTENPTSFSTAEYISKAKGSAAIKKGDTSALIENVITGVGTYYAALIPVSEEYIANGGYGQITSKATSVKVQSSNTINIKASSATVVVIEGLEAYDQFGNICSAAETTEKTAAVTVSNAAAATTTGWTGKYTVGSTGLIKLTLTAPSAATIAEGDKLNVSILGSTLVIEASKDITVGTTDFNGNSKITFDETSLTVTGNAVGTSVATSLSASAVSHAVTTSDNEQIGTVDILDQYGVKVTHNATTTIYSDEACSAVITTIDGTATTGTITIAQDGATPPTTGTYYAKITTSDGTTVLGIVVINLA